MATDLYSVITGLEVTTDEILQAELAAEKILEARFPDLDLRLGTGLRDMVIRPNATLLALINKAVAYYFAQNTLQGADDTTSTEIVDKILSNWFLERKAGEKSVISARMYFATKKNVTISSDIFFSTDNTKKFYPVQTYTIGANDLTYDSFSAEYYVDIDLVADKEGTEYDLTSGSLLYFTNFDPYFLRGEINYLESIASVTETNTQFIRRARSAISTRNLINQPSIEARLKQDFNFIDYVTSVGMSDAEMWRDQVEVKTPNVTDPVPIHIGGKTDIYVRLPMETRVLQFPTDAQGVCTIPGAYYELMRSPQSGGSAEDTIPVLATFTTSNAYQLTKPITSISRNGTVVTVACKGHGLIPGRMAQITLAAPASFNGWIKVATVNQNEFTFNASTSLPVAATTPGLLTLIDYRYDYGLSPRQVTNVAFGAGYANKTASFILKGFKGMDSIQDYLELDNNKVLAGDPIVRSYNTYFLTVNIVAYNGVIPSATLCADVVNAYLKGLTPGSAFIMADLISKLNDAGVVTIKTPIDVTYRYFNRDGSPIQTGSIVDYLTPPERTCTFMLEALNTSNQYL